MKDSGKERHRRFDLYSYNYYGLILIAQYMQYTFLLKSNIPVLYISYAFFNECTILFHSQTTFGILKLEIANFLGRRFGDFEISGSEHWEDRFSNEGCIIGNALLSFALLLMNVFCSKTTEQCLKNRL